MVEVLVQVFDRGERKQEIIPVEESCFEPGHFCWKSIAALKAAVVMEMPFVQVERVAKFGLRPGLLWGWNAEKAKNYGSASYASNGVPDYGANTMINVCTGVSTSFVNIVPGEAIWKSGHIGIYIGGGLAVESSPSWENGVQITAVGNIGSKSGYHTRTWTKHGKLPYVDYTEAPPKPAPDPVPEPESWTRDEIEQIVTSVFHNCMEQDAVARRDNDAGEWSKDAREWAIET